MFGLEDTPQTVPLIGGCSQYCSKLLLIENLGGVIEKMKDHAGLVNIVGFTVSIPLGLSSILPSKYCTFTVDFCSTSGKFPRFHCLRTQTGGKIIAHML